MLPFDDKQIMSALSRTSFLLSPVAPLLQKTESELLRDALKKDERLLVLP